MNTIHVDVVSVEESVFSGEARFVALPGEIGELGIYPAPHAADHADQAGFGAHREG
jgi:F0F1-type ATP synthase epsilon subunit